MFGSAGPSVAFVWAFCSHVEWKRLFFAVHGGFSLWRPLLSSNMGSTLVSPRLSFSPHDVWDLCRAALSLLHGRQILFYFYFIF